MDLFWYLLCSVAVIVFLQDVDSRKENSKHVQKKKDGIASRFANVAKSEDLELAPKYGFIIISGNGYVIGMKRGLSDQIGQILKREKQDLPNQHGHGGQSQNRFMRTADEKRDAYRKRVAEAAKEIFIKKNPQTDNYEVTISALIIAGNAKIKDELAPLLDERLSNLDKKVLTIEKEKEDGFKEALKSSADYLKNLEIKNEGAAVSEYLETCDRDSEKCVYSANDVAYSLGVKCVAKILYLESANYFRYKIKTKNGNEKEKFIEESKVKEKLSPGDIVIEKESMLNWMQVKVMESGTQITFIREEALNSLDVTQRQMFKGFGSVAGILYSGCKNSDLNIEDASMDQDKN